MFRAPGGAFRVMAAFGVRSRRRGRRRRFGAGVNANNPIMQVTNSANSKVAGFIDVHGAVLGDVSPQGQFKTAHTASVSASIAFKMGGCGALAGAAKTMGLEVYEASVVALLDGKAASPKKALGTHE